MTPPDDPTRRGDCLTEGTILRLVRGELAQDRDDIEAHLDLCPSCRALLADAARIDEQARREQRPVQPGDETLPAVPASDEPRRTGGVKPARAEGPPAAPAQKQRGETVGRYVIVDVLGAGGMGVVYAAYDPELDRKVALKILRPGLGELVDSQGFRDRLRREGQAMARLRHPNVIKVYDVSTKPGELFVAMELVDGITLGAWLRERKRSWREIVGVFGKAGAGLAAAHEAGLVHRDFKPDNVLLSRSGDVFVTDFGLARALDAHEPAVVGPASDVLSSSPAWQTPLTVTGQLVGTPIYMAPEQLLGTHVDARADVYSFCTALYEALYGTRPYEAKTIEELRRQVQAGQLPEPDGGARVPSWLRRIVLRGLRPSPNDRQASMRALLDELSQDPRARWRRVALLAVVALTVASLALVQREMTRSQLRVCRGGEQLIGGVWDAPRRAAVERAFAASGRPQATLAFAYAAAALDEWTAGWLRARQESCAATRLRGEQSAEMLDLRMACFDARLAEERVLVDLFAQADGSIVDRAAAAARSLEPPSSCSADALLHSGDKLPQGTAARARVAALDDELASMKPYENAGHYADGARVAGEVVVAAEREHFDSRAAQGRYWTGVFAYHLGKLDVARAEVARAAAAALAIGRDDVAGRAYSFLAILEGSQQRHFDTAHLALDVAGAAVQRLGTPPTLEAYRLRQLASVLTNEERFSEAIDVYQRALAMQRSAARNSLLEAELDLGLARCLTEAGRNVEALETISRACALYTQLFGPDYPTIGEAQLQVGFILRQLKRGDEAVAAMKRAVAARQAYDGPEHPAFVEALVYLGDALVWRGRPSEGIPVLERAIAIGEKIKTPYPDVPVALIRLGWAHLALGQKQLARDELERALAHPKTSELGGELGDAKFGLAQLIVDSDRPRALRLAHEARAALAKWPDSDHKGELERWLLRYESLRR